MRALGQLLVHDEPILAEVDVRIRSLAVEVGPDPLGRGSSRSVELSLRSVVDDRRRVLTQTHQLGRMLRNGDSARQHRRAPPDRPRPGSVDREAHRPCVHPRSQRLVRWLNKAAVDQFGDLRGKRASHVVAPEDADRARREFAGKLLGTIEATDATTDLRTADGRTVRVDISSTQLIDHGAVVGVFGLADPVDLPDVPARQVLGPDSAPAGGPPASRGGPLDGPHRADPRDRRRDGAQPRARHPGRARACTRGSKR